MRRPFHLCLLAIALLLIIGCASMEKDWYRVELHQAVTEGNAIRVKTLIDNGADVNMRFGNKGALSPLTVAIIEDHYEVAKVLLDNGANVNELIVEGNTPLILASTRGQKDFVELLVNNGADINVKSQRGTTAISAASEKGYTEIVQILKQAVGRNR